MKETTRVIEICWECWQPIYTVSDPYLVSGTADIDGPLSGLWFLHGNCFDKRIKRNRGG